jgi:hypothetical protein
MVANKGKIQMLRVRERRRESASRETTDEGQQPMLRLHATFIHHGGSRGSVALLCQCSFQAPRLHEPENPKDSRFIVLQLAGQAPIIGHDVAEVRNGIGIWGLVGET